MDLGSIFLILALFVGVGFYVAQPFVQRKSTMVTAKEQQVSALMAERDRILDALQELDFDHTLGKIPEADYPLQREFLITKGAEIIKQLDTFQSNGKKGGKDQVEAAIAARKKVKQQGSAIDGKTQAPLPIVDDELENLIAARRRERKEGTAGFCAQCGHPIQKSDKFCSICGATL